MKIPNKGLSISLLLLVFGFMAQAQWSNFRYQRKLEGLQDSWHRIPLSDSIYQHLQPSYGDLRIYGITEGQDTIEAPYLLHINQDSERYTDVDFEMLNQSRRGENYYYTFVLKEPQRINDIELDFEGSNFDWRALLEGSMDQSEWFELVDNQRLLAINKPGVDFRLTRFNFPPSQYKYYRLRITSSVNPGLRGARVRLKQSVEGEWQTIPLKKMEVQENQSLQQTEIELEFHFRQRLDRLRLFVEDTFDYYRPVRMSYLVDSFKTEKGWSYNYHPFSAGLLNSMEPKAFRGSGVLTRRLRISISNKNNQPLRVSRIKAEALTAELKARFNRKAEYYLCFGSAEMGAPSYDISYFQNNIPNVLEALELGPEKVIKMGESNENPGLFTNSLWLWVLMGVIILLLTWFSIKMIREP